MHMYDNKQEIRRVSLKELQAAGVEEVVVVSGVNDRGWTSYQVRLPLEVAEATGAVSRTVADKIRKQRERRNQKKSGGLTAPIGTSVKVLTEEVPYGE